MKHVSPRAAARALKRVSACGPIGLSASSALVENQKRIKNKKEKREASALRGPKSEWSDAKCLRMLK